MYVCTYVYNFSMFLLPYSQIGIVSGVEKLFPGIWQFLVPFVSLGASLRLRGFSALTLTPEDSVPFTLVQARDLLERCRFEF